ncbi:MAG: heat-inducible transcriptional repressor HrcA [Bifidobacterium sp.]|nr:heat-inducible transcriptional repressor HrcA [Bifidobacterium sp.]
MTQTRRMQVLRAVVEDYIHTQDPVGSATLIERHDLGVSSATIRKDMAALEKEGYLAQPHTSAGRVPTELAYRYYVDSLADGTPRESGNGSLREELGDATSLQDALQRAARTLSCRTGQVALVAAPSLSKSHLWHLELIAVASHTLLAVVVTDTGRVAQHILSVPSLPQDGTLSALADDVNAQCSTLTLRETAERVRALHPDGELHPLVDKLATAFDDMANEEYAHELFTAGVASLAHQRASATELALLFDALEERSVLMRLMSAVGRAPSNWGVGVAIGSETGTPGLLHAAVVSSGYGMDPDADGTDPVAFVGSIGPTHMNYGVAMASVHAVARYLTAFLSHDANDR